MLDAVGVVGQLQEYGHTGCGTSPTVCVSLSGGRTNATTDANNNVLGVARFYHHDRNRRRGRLGT